MPMFAKPKFAYTVDVAAEKQRYDSIDSTETSRGRQRIACCLPPGTSPTSGPQLRRDEHLMLLAEVLSWFDIIALQEVRENFGDLDKLQKLLGALWKVVFSDAAGNDERMVFVYDSSRVTLLEKIGEIAYPVAALKQVKLKGINAKFEGFDRNPYLATFSAGRLSFLLVNVHLYYGQTKTPAQKKASMNRRALETFAVALWAQKRVKSTFSFTRNVVALGDFNMPKRDPTDAIYKALTSKGLHLPPFSTSMGSNLAGDADYDQIAFFPGETEDSFTDVHGVFDFDKVVFPDLWNNGQGKKNFNSYVKYYMSDHRPMWMQFRTA